MVYIYEDGTLLEEWEIPLNPPIEIREDVMVFANLNNEQKISNLKSRLQSTDYIVLKIAESDTEEETQMLRQTYMTELENRKLWRFQINELENKLKI